MRVGKLRDRVIVQAIDQSAVDDIGQPLDTATDLGTYWANVRELQGREAVNARQVKAELTHQVTIRNLGIRIQPGLHQLVEASGPFKGRVLGIDSIVDVDGKGHHFELVCKAVL